MADFLKFKLALAKTRRPQIHNIYSTDISQSPDKYGLIANETDYDLGTPNLKRPEDITLMASNSTSKEIILLTLKWRPATGGPDEGQNLKLVTLVSRLLLVTSDKSVYEYEHIETYQPAESSVRAGRIMQYGSSGSQLKLQIGSPYRRLRLLFHGQMRLIQRGDGQKPTGTQLNFVKINAVASPVANVFDFNRQFDANCFKLSYEKFKPTRSYAATIEELLYHDRHEQLTRLRAEISVENADGTKSKSVSFLWGVYARQYPEDPAKKEAPQTKRIFVTMNNGQMWHIGQSTIGSDSIDFGYTCFEIISVTHAIEKPTEIEWDSIDASTRQFSALIHGQQKSYKYEATARIEGLPFYDVTMEVLKGWAWISLDQNGVDSAQQLEAIELSRREFTQALETGSICRPVPKTAEFERPLVVGLNELACFESDIVGSKAASLAQLKSFAAASNKSGSANYTVPRAFAATKFAHDAILEGNASLREAVERLSELVGRGDLSRLRQESEALQKQVADVKLPAQVCSELGAKLREEFGDQLERVPFAVRSSSWGEDEEGMSAAGQLSTLLGVRGLESIYSATMKCFASKFSYENLEYKRQHGLPLDLPMAVIVQEMIDCDKAGVLFTCDPTNGNEAVMTITANYGLGESVVSGQSDPDSIRVKCAPDGQLSIDKVEVGAKKVVVDGKTLALRDQATDYDKSKCCLSDAEIISLAECGRALARYFQSARDIEWGFINDSLHLFQSRPVTGLETYTDEELIHEIDLPSRAEVDFFSRANVGEVMPCAIKPLTMTYLVHMWNIIGLKFQTMLSSSSLPMLSPQVTAMVQYDYYHTLFTIRSSSFMVLARAGEKKSLMGKAMEIGMFGHEVEMDDDLAEATRYITKVPNMFEGFRFKYRSLPLRYFTMATILREKKTMARLRAQLRSSKLTKETEGPNRLMGLYKQLAILASNAMRAWTNHLFVIALAGESNMILLAVLSKFITDPTQLFAALSKFLGASPNVLSAEIPQRIADIAQIIKSKGDAEKFSSLSTEEALKYIDEDAKLKEEYAVFLHRFGHRTYNEFELHEKAWREDQGVIMDMLKVNCRQVKTGDQATDTTNQLGLSNKPSVEQILDSLEIKDLDSKTRSVIVKYLAPKCQLMVAAREQTKDIYVELVDIEREAMRMLAAELRRQLRIPDDELMYYLLYDELVPLIEGHKPSLVMQALKRRAMFQKHFSVLWKFDEIIRGAEIVPNHLKEARKLDEKLANAPKLHGTPASSGRVRGKICLVDGYKELDKVRPGNILLTHSTDIGFSPVFPMISGIITEVGGLISHGAVVAREYGLPSVLGIPEVTRILQDGEEIILDADSGTIIRLGLSGGETTAPPGEPNGAAVAPAN